MQQELEMERAEKLKMLAKKNAEVAYFKAELDTLLGEIQSATTKKKGVVC
jgi:hypothetical protein